MKVTKLIVALTALAVLALAAAGPAAAKRKDRNHDRIPDRWEKRHHLSLHKKQGRRDQDRDGLKNRAEFHAKTDPRSADSDGDGTDDGDEGAGKVASFDPATGELVINLYGGSTVSGLVTDQTTIRCGCKGTDDDYEDGAGDASPTPMHGDDSGDDGSDESGDDGSESDHSGSGEVEGEHGHGDDRTCSTDELVEGAVVSEADLSATADGLVFDEIELVKKNPDGQPNG